MSTMDKIRIDFPLRGEWTAAHTPAEKVPSHGVDVFGQTYAFDFVRIDWGKQGFVTHGKSTLQYYTVGVDVRDCYGFGEPILCPADGTVVATKDGLEDHHRLQPFADLFAVLARTLFIGTRKNLNVQKIAGNYIVLKISGVEAYAFFAHLKNGTIRVKEGEEVAVGVHLADVGHTGNSTAPHLHFHIMDRVDFFSARGLPCVFKRYEAFEGGGWVARRDAVPGLRERIRA